MAIKNFSLFLALRYIRPKRTFVSIITVISILGVTLGVMVLILVLSVMTGFQRELEEKIVGFEAHAVVNFANKPSDDWWNVMQLVKKQKDVVGVAPYVMGPVLVEFKNRHVAPQIRAIDPELETSVTDIRKYIVDGEYDLDGDKTILGSELAAVLDAHVGDKIIIYSPKNLSEIVGNADDKEKEVDPSKAKQMLVPTELEVSGIFESGRYQYDSQFLLVPLHIGQEVYDLGGAVHGLAVKMTDRHLAPGLRDTLNAELEPPAMALTWIDLNKQFFDAVRMERNVLFFLLLFIVIVAAFGIMNTLITVTVQKTRDIGVMKALGARSSQIIGVFFAQGIVVGFIGTIGGLASGMFFVQYRNEVAKLLSEVFHIEVFPREVYEFSLIPAEVVPSDVILICVSAFIICALAALIPAWFAARLDPVKALRYE
jgi:lipoprotein-releasing system permease protein